MFYAAIEHSFLPYISFVKLYTEDQNSVRFTTIEIFNILNENPGPRQRQSTVLKVNFNSEAKRGLRRLQNFGK